MTADLLLHLISRFIHIASAILFLGAVAYARQVLVPVLNSVPEANRPAAASAAQAKFRGTLFVLLVLIVCSGLYNFFSYTGPKHTTTYQAWFGVKMLLVAHVLATAILWATSPFGDVHVGSKAKHRLVSVTISGLIIVLISSYLRSLTQRGL